MSEMTKEDKLFDEQVNEFLNATGDLPGPEAEEDKGEKEVEGKVKDEEKPPVEEEVPAEEAEEEKPPEEEEEAKVGEEEPPKEGEEEEEESKVDEEKEALRQQVEELSDQLMRERSQIPSEAPPAEEEPPAEKKVAPEVKATQFVPTDEEFSEAMGSREKLNELLLKVQTQSVATVLKSLPTIMERMEDQRNVLTEHTQKFYGDNPDLVKHHKFVGLTAQKIRSAEPTKPIDDVLKEAGDKVREDLKLAKQAEVIEGKRGKIGSQGPGLKGGKTKTRKGAALKGGSLADEIEMLNKI